MHWSSAGSLTMLKAVVKFKILAGRATTIVESHASNSLDLDVLTTPREKRRLKINKVKEGKALLTQRLDFLKLKSVQMQGDGNCQFRSFSSELFGTQDDHMYVRSVAISFMKAHVKDFSAFVGRRLKIIQNISFCCYGAFILY